MGQRGDKEGFTGEKEIYITDQEQWHATLSLCWNCKTNCDWMLYRFGNEWWYKIWDLAYKCKMPPYQQITCNDPYMYRIVKCKHFVKGKVSVFNPHGGRPKYKNY